jgi:hypothetical protein
MVQFYTFLSNVLTTENFHHQFPSIDNLVLGFHLQVDAAFHISRPLFNLNIQVGHNYQKDEHFFFAFRRNSMNFEQQRQNPRIKVFW